jgi:hypothetical protein
MKKEVINLLKKEIRNLDSAAAILRYSYDNCRQIGIKKKFIYEERDQFESLTSRFARMSDLLIKKVFRLIERLDMETMETVRDSINRAEKIGLIDNADVFSEIRILRNEIAHQYQADEFAQIFKQVLLLSPVLFSCVAQVKQYSKKFI